MVTDKRVIAAVGLMLILPAALFLTAVVARHLQPLPTEAAHAAREVVAWYSSRVWTLWVLLIGLPLAALLTGFVTLLQRSNGRIDERQTAHSPSSVIRRRWPTRIIAATTLAAGLILTIVALHILAN